MTDKGELVEQKIVLVWGAMFIISQNEQTT